MCDECDEELCLLICCVCYLNQLALNRDFWVHSFYQQRSLHGFDNYLLPMILEHEKRKVDHISFQSYFRVSYELFEEMCNLLSESLSVNHLSLRNDTLSVKRWP